MRRVDFRRWYSEKSRVEKKAFANVDAPCSAEHDENGDRSSYPV